MKRYFLLLFLFACLSGYSQGTINNYKYVIVPQKFSQFEKIDQYSLNRLTKALLEDKGFTAYFEGTDMPNELANNKCQALTADLMQKSGMFTTEVTLLLRDCKGSVVYTSKTGKSREKEYKTAYNLALRDAFTSLSYSYSGAVTEPTQSAVAAASPEKTAVTSVAPVPPPVVAPATAVQAPPAATTRPAGTLYAQVIANGYQLIDTTPKIVLTLLKTSAENYYIATTADASGVVLKKGEDWYFEYYRGGKLISEKLLVKF
jgi:hypothetical protein